MADTISPFELRHSCISMAQEMCSSQQNTPKYLEHVFLTATKIYNFVNGDFNQIPEISDKINMVDKQKNNSKAIEIISNKNALDDTILSEINSDNYQTYIDKLDTLKKKISEKIEKEQEETENEIYELKKIAGVNVASPTPSITSTIMNCAAASEEDLPQLYSTLKEYDSHRPPVIVTTEAETITDFIKPLDIKPNITGILEIIHMDAFKSVTKENTSNVVIAASYLTINQGMNTVILLDNNNHQPLLMKLLSLCNPLSISSSESYSAYTYFGKTIYMTTNLDNLPNKDDVIKSTDYIFATQQHFDRCNKEYHDVYKGKVLVMN